MEFLIGTTQCLRALRSYDARLCTNVTRLGFLIVFACLTSTSLMSAASSASRSETCNLRKATSFLMAQPRALLGSRRAVPRASETRARQLGLLSRSQCEWKRSSVPGRRKRAQRWQGAVEPQQQRYAQIRTGHARTNHAKSYSAGQQLFTRSRDDEQTVSASDLDAAFLE